MRGEKVTVTLQGPGERIRDDEGRWSALGNPEVVEAVVASASAGYSSLSARERDKDAGVILLPSTVAVDTEHLVELQGARRLPDGTYRVEHVTRTRKHLRCLLQRHRPEAS